MNDKEFLDAMEHIVSALMERGYDPYAQLTGYVTENEPTYITSYKGARQLMLFVIGKGEDIVATVGSIVMVIDLIILIAPIFPTEKALKKTFDKDGNRKAE